MENKSDTFQLVPGIFSGRLDSTTSAALGGQDHVCLGLMTLLEAYLTAHPARHECSVTARSNMLYQRASLRCRSAFSFRGGQLLASSHIMCV